MAHISNPHIISPRKPSWKRFLHFISSPYTLYRGLEYEIVSQETFSGRVLDVGGGEKVTYRKILKINGTYESVNGASDIGATIEADLNTGIPAPDQTYDTIISLNTLEHVYKIDFTVEEMHRILKPGGSVFIAVPFLYRVHGSPNDFHRKTASWWQTKMLETGFNESSLTIEPILWDAWSTGFSLTERYKFFFIPYRVRRILALLPGLIKSLLYFREQNETIPSEALAACRDLALGYVIRAKKP